MVHRLEIFLHIAHGFACTQEQETAGPQGKAKHIKRALLQVCLEINQQIATTDKINAGEGRVLDKVVLGKNHHFPQGARHMIGVAAAVEVFCEQGRIQIRGDALGIGARARPGNGVAVYIGGKYFNVPEQAQGLHDLARNNRQCVGLFAC